MSDKSEDEQSLSLEDERKRKRSVSSNHEEVDDDNEDVKNTKPAPAATAKATTSPTPTPAPALTKKQKFGDRFSTQNGLFLISETPTSLQFEIIPQKVGHIIGSQGMIIVDLGRRSGAKIIVNQDFPPGAMRQVNITGTKDQIELAADLIRRIVDFGPTAIHENSLTGGVVSVKMIECSQEQVGKIIGTAGCNIKQIQSKSGAKIQVYQDFPPDQPRKIEITGTHPAIDAAEKLIRDIMSSIGAAHLGGGGFGPYGGGGAGGRGGAPRYPPTGPYGAPPYGAGGFPPRPMMGGMMPPRGMPLTPQPGEIHQVLEVPRAIVGRLIGKGGENIQMIQRRSGCRAHVDQSAPEGMPGKMTVTGIPHNVNIAIGLVREIESGLHTNEIGRNLPQPLPGPGMPAGPYGAAPGPYGAAPGGYPPADPYGAGGYGPYGQAPNLTAYANPYAMPGAGGPGVGGAAPYDAYGGYRGPAGGAPGAPGAMGGYQQGGHYGAPGAMGGAGGPYGMPTAPVAAPTPAPAAKSTEWSEHKTEDGIPYWYNSRTRESQWTRPPGF